MKPTFTLKKFFFFLLFSFYYCHAIISIPLKASFSEAHRNKFLMSLKLLQISAKNPSFLQEVTLHQQVIAQKRLATYYGDIGVGTGVGNDNNRVQSFKMLFDTGSCEFWIPSSRCSTTRCLTHQRYLTSNTFENYNGAAMSIQYLSGKVQGEMARETIHLGDLEVKGQIIGVANEVQIPLLDEVIWDGILGLAYPNANLKRQKIKPLFDTIISQNLLKSKGEKNQFAYYLGPERGAISFGGADMRYKRSVNEEFVWAPISEENYWTIALYDVRIEEENNLIKNNKKSQKKLCPNGCKAIIDTGTYLIYGPSEVLQKYFHEMSLDSCERKKDLPNIVFEFRGEGIDKSIELVVTPEDYVLQFKIDGQDDCVIGIGPDNEDSGWTLGQVFLKAFYTVFDRDNNRIGFVRAKSDPTLISEVKTGNTLIPDHPPEEKQETRKLFKNDDEPHEEPKIFRKYREEKTNGQISDDSSEIGQRFDQDGGLTTNNGAVKDSGTQYLNILPEWQT